MRAPDAQPVLPTKADHRDGRDLSVERPAALVTHHDDVSRRRVAMRKCNQEREKPKPMRPDDEMLYSNGLFAEPKLEYVKRGAKVMLRTIWDEEACVA